MSDTTERVELKGKQVVVVGHRGSGKSTWVQNALDEVPGHLVYDFTREHDGYNRWLPTHRRGEQGHAELNGVLDAAVISNTPSRRPGLVVVEEANRVIPNRGSIPESVAEMVDLGRHYQRPSGKGVGVIYLARRPSQLDTDVIELADYLVVYRVRGSNDVKRLNLEADGLGDAARELDDYHYLLVKPDRSYVEMNPVAEGDTTGAL